MNNIIKHNQVKQQSSNPMPITSAISMAQGRPTLNNQPSGLIINNSITTREVEVKEDHIVPLEHNTLSSGNDICRPRSPVPSLDFSNLYLSTHANSFNYPNKEEIEKSIAAFLEQMNLKNIFVKP